MPLPTSNSRILADCSQAPHPTLFTMPEVQFADKTIQCQPGENLRHVLLRAGLPLYNGAAKLIHCRGLGTCGTCAVRITGDVTKITAIEKWRLNFPPHRKDSGLRLACQCKVLGDLKIQKLNGLWGNEQNAED